jgi:hypothetical protein
MRPGGIAVYFKQVDVRYLVKPLKRGRRRHSDGTERKADPLA